jgi:hypothetical protein
VASGLRKTATLRQKRRTNHLFEMKIVWCGGNHGQRTDGSTTPAAHARGSSATRGGVSDYNARIAVSHHVPVFTLVIWAGFFVYPLQAQIPIREVGAVEGPWECRNTNGTAGFFITAHTFLGEGRDQQNIASQSITIRVYQRQGEQEHRGYFSPSTGLDRSNFFDGKRLVIHVEDRADIPPFDLDVSFDPAAGHWTGSLSLCDKLHEVILERPRAKEGVRPSAFVGDWEGYPDPTAKFPRVPGTLHIKQGYDGRVTAWLDLTIEWDQTDQRESEELSVLSVTQSSIVLTTLSPVAPTSRYEGMLSGDGKQMSGQWYSDPPGAGTLIAPTLYRLLDQSKGRD